MGLVEIYVESMSKLRHCTVYPPVYTLYVNPLRSNSLTLVAGREIESINKLANDISIYPQRRSLSAAKLILFRITLLCSTFKINFISPAVTDEDGDGICDFFSTKLNGIAKV